MKKFSLIFAAVLLAGCSTTKSPTIESPKITAIGNQNLTSTFKRQGIKIEWECAWGTGAFGLTNALCVNGNIKAIEVTGYANSFGNSEVLRERAFIAAEMDAKARLVRFINETVTTNNFIQTVSKNVEKAQDRIKNRIAANEEVAMSDDDANKDTNFAVRENTNEVVRTLTESIRNNAEGKLRGAMVKESDIVDRQTVKVTIRWDKNSENALKYIRKNLSGS